MNLKGRAAAALGRAAGAVIAFPFVLALRAATKAMNLTEKPQAGAARHHRPLEGANRPLGRKWYCQRCRRTFDSFWAGLTHHCREF